MKFSSDFIVGFCGETEDDHKATIDLVRLADYTFVYCFQYSMRQVKLNYYILLDILYIVYNFDSLHGDLFSSVTLD